MELHTHLVPSPWGLCTMRRETDHEQVGNSEGEKGQFAAESRVEGGGPAAIPSMALSWLPDVLSLEWGLLLSRALVLSLCMQ